MGTERRGRHIDGTSDAEEVLAAGRKWWFGLEASIFSGKFIKVIYWVRVSGIDDSFQKEVKIWTIQGKQKGYQLEDVR